jgi:hypothetical protein
MTSVPNARDELAGILAGVVNGPETGSPITRAMADAVLAAGYTKPRTVTMQVALPKVTTAAALDALPTGTVVLESDGYVARRFPGGWRVLVVEPSSSPWLSDTLEDLPLPATVLHEPEERE